MNEKTTDQSIIVEIDDATRNVMEDIQGRVDSSIANIVDDVKSVKSDLEQSTDSIMSKLRGLNALDDTIDELRKASQESMKLTEMVSPLNDNLIETENHIITELKTVNESLKEISGDVLEIKTNTIALLSLSSRIDELQNLLVHFEQKVMDESVKMHHAIAEQSEANNEAFEKIMLVLNIIKNLCTPFWKRKKKDE